MLRTRAELRTHRQPLGGLVVVLLVSVVLCLLIVLEAPVIIVRRTGVVVRARLTEGRTRPGCVVAGIRHPLSGDRIRLRET